MRLNRERRDCSRKKAMGFKKAISTTGSWYARQVPASVPEIRKTIVDDDGAIKRWKSPWENTHYYRFRRDERNDDGQKCERTEPHRATWLFVIWLVDFWSDPISMHLIDRPHHQDHLARTTLSTPRSNEMATGLHPRYSAEEYSVELKKEWGEKAKISCIILHTTLRSAI